MLKRKSDPPASVKIPTSPPEHLALGRKLEGPYLAEESKASDLVSSVSDAAHRFRCFLVQVPRGLAGVAELPIKKFLWTQALMHTIRTLLLLGLRSERIISQGYVI